MNDSSENDELLRMIAKMEEIVQKLTIAKLHCNMSNGKVQQDIQQL